jgi:hypothetical protein
VASVRRCIDCDVMLVDEERPDGELIAPSAATPIGDGDEVAYELDGWSNQLKLSLEGMLDREGIRRVWEAAVLVVPKESETQVDALIATVEGVEVLDALDDNVVQVAFDLNELTADEIEELDARLVASEVVHKWTDEAELLVPEESAAAAEAMVDAVINPSGEADDDGLALQERLTSLFLAVDKLVKDPFDPKAVGRFVTASEGISDLGVPYGLAGEDWSSFLGLIEDLRSAISEPRGADDEVEGGTDGADAGATRRSQAHDLVTTLRERLRDLV